MKYTLDDLSAFEEDRKEPERGSIDDNSYAKENWLYETVKEMAHSNSFILLAQRMGLGNNYNKAQALCAANQFLNLAYQSLYKAFGNDVYNKIVENTEHIKNTYKPRKIPKCPIMKVAKALEGKSGKFSSYIESSNGYSCMEKDCGMYMLCYNVRI